MLLENIKLFLFLQPLQGNTDSGNGEMPEWPKGTVC